MNQLREYRTRIRHIRKKPKDLPKRMFSGKYDINKMRIR